MQPDDNQSFQDAPADSIERGPVVSLSPDDIQPIGGTEPGDNEPQEGTSASTNEPIHWQANEYLHSEKDHIWFVLFALVYTIHK